MSSKIVKRFVLLLFFVVISFILLETFVGWKYPQVRTYQNYRTGHNEYPAVYSDYLPFTLPPNMIFQHQRAEFEVVYNTNLLGYIGNNPKSIEKNHDVKRIIFLGDSFTLGWGNFYNETFAGLLESNFSDSNLEIINAAYHAGYSPDSYYAYLYNEGKNLSLDKIFVMIYTGNDIEDMQTTIWEEIDKLTGAPLKLSTLRDYTDYMGNIINKNDQWYYKVPILRNFRTYVVISKLVDKNLIFKFRDVSYDEAFNKFKISLMAIKKFSEENNQSLVFVLIPPKLSKFNDNVDYNNIYNFITQELHSESVSTKENLTEEHYYTIDGHLNHKGNKLLFELLRNEIIVDI